MTELKVKVKGNVVKEMKVLKFKGYHENDENLHIHVTRGIIISVIIIDTKIVFSKSFCGSSLKRVLVKVSSIMKLLSLPHETFYLLHVKMKHVYI